MEVAERYKQTEIGVIPAQWDTKKIEEVAFATSGKRLPKGYSVTDTLTPHPYVRVADMRSGTVALNDIKYVPVRAFPAIRNYRIFSKDLFISVAGTLGIVGKVPTLLSGANLTENADRLTDIKCDQDYLMYVLQSPLIQETIAAIQTVAAQPKLALTRLRQFIIPLPPEKEQRAIAEALKDTDALIQSLNQLITKKRDMKQAAMQQLLTGKTRLPGFESAWVLRPLGEVLKVRHGKGHRDVESHSGGVPILGTGGLMGYATRPLYDRPSVLIGRKGTIDRPVYMDRPFWTVDTLFYSEILGNNSARFLYYRFCLIDWKQYNEASGVPSLNAKTIERIEILCPRPDEQVAIASVLADIDSELLQLEILMAKTSEIKHGMMQQLLTGKVRLA